MLTIFQVHHFMCTIPNGIKTSREMSKACLWSESTRMRLSYVVQGLDWEILRDFLHEHMCTVMMVSSWSPQAVLFLFLTCYREVRSCYQPPVRLRDWRRNRSPKPLLRGLNGDSRLTLLVAVMWYSTRPRRRQSTPSLWSATAGVATEKPCSLAVAEGLPPPLESLHTWKLNLIFARWSSWDLA